ncbi:MAG TPA: hypothetical protein VD908_02760 [Cytophagales bacterium]|nr:hypothetical protein [Cytophagales bacterium]
MRDEQLVTTDQAGKVSGIWLIIDKFSANPERLFMVDGFGALLTAFLLGVILARFEDSFGMPQTILYFLSSVACIYSIYSFCCCFFVFSNWVPYLKAITIANLIYCCLTIGLIFYFYQSLTFLGLIYFFLEIMVMIGLMLVELMVILKKLKQ